MKLKENIILKLKDILQNIKNEYNIIGDIDIDLGTIVEKSKASSSDFSITCFALAKVLKKSPVDIANKIAESLEKEKIEYIDKIEVINGYVNIFLNRRYIMFSALKDVKKREDRI